VQGSPGDIHLQKAIVAKSEIHNLKSSNHEFSVDKNYTFVSIIATITFIHIVLLIELPTIPEESINIKYYEKV